MKVVIGPLNIASQPYYLAEGLRKHGIDAHCVAYDTGSFGYNADKEVKIPRMPLDRVDAFHRTHMEALEEDFDIYHFFQRPFYLPVPNGDHDSFLGFDIPLLKARGKRVAYRFTGWEVIDRETELRNNPYSAFRHGWDGRFNPEFKAEYLDFLRAQVDAFMVVDPMMQEHCPEADMVPRILPVQNFEEVGIKKTDVPLIVHAPSNSIYKGSKFVLEALEALRNEGVRFNLQLLDRVPYTEALDWFHKADIIIDQALIGWYGVLATECMAMGKPVAVYMREDLADTPGEIPIHNFNLDNIKDRFRDLIGDFELRDSLARRGRAYVEATHGEAAVIPKLINVYKRMIERPNIGGGETGDFEFLRLQRRRYEEMTAEITQASNIVARDRARRQKSEAALKIATKQAETLRARLSTVAEQSQRYKKKVLAAHEQRERKDDAINKAQSEAEEKMRRIDDLEMENAALVAERDLVIRDYKASERLAAELESSKAALVAMEGERDRQKSARTIATEKILELHQREQRLKERLAILQGQAAAAQTKLDKQQSLVNRMPSYLAKIEDLRAREVRLKEKLATATEDATNVRAKYEARLADIGAKHTAKLDELQTRLANIKIREHELKAALSAQQAN